ncbi:MAG: amidohydrolase family protein, partial [Chloroflexota bacterium]
LLTNYVSLIPPDVKTLDDLLAKLKPAIAKAKPGEWVQGYYWDIDPPTRAQLDPISPDNPVWLMQQGGHFASVNSAALKIANITAQTRNPEGGVIERDKQGNPTGVFYNHRAMDLVRAHIPQPTPQQIADSLRAAEMRMAEVGVTTYHDNNARFNAVQGYLQVAHAKSMMLRSQVYYTLEWPADLDRALKQIERINDEHMRFAGYKFLIDGQFPTWYTHEPHPGISWNMPTWNPNQYKQTIKALHDSGLQIAVHSCGDAAIDLTLDAYEAAMKANPRKDPRHRLEHAILCSKDAVKRAADLGVVISCQPQFVRIGGNLPDKIGAERAKRVIVTREWMNAGVKLALGSDTPTSPWYAPQVTLAESVLRLDQFDKPFNPEQALTIQEALRMHTMGSAYACFEENSKGSLEPGKFADLAVWNANLYTIKPEEILQAKIELTMIGGKIVYQKT